MNTQTIVKDIKDLSHLDGESGDFVQTEFDNEVETFVEGLLEEDKFPIAMHFLTGGEKLICVIMYAEMSQEQKNQIRAQKSGLSVLNQKITIPG